MDAYIDIRLRPDPEFPMHQLMDALYAKLHRALVQAGHGRIGISFPKWRKGPNATLGDCMRLHGTQGDLVALMSTDWLRGMRDHVEQTVLASASATGGTLLVRRAQAKSTSKLRKRAMKRHGYSEAEATRRIPEDAGDRLDFPFVTHRSTSTGQAFKLFIDQRVGNTTACPGFNTQGLSTGGCVPAS